MDEILTRDEARALFAKTLSYEQIDPNDIRALEGFLAIEYAQHDRLGGCMMMHPSYRKKHRPEIDVTDCGTGIRSAFLRVDGCYFRGREAISFNEDGLIGFAGWADDVNVQPFLRAFAKWVNVWMGGGPAGYEGLKRLDVFDRGFICALVCLHGEYPKLRDEVLHVLVSNGFNSIDEALRCRPDEYDANRLREIYGAETDGQLS